QWDGRSFRRLMLGSISPQEPSVSTLLAARDGSCWVAGARGLFHFQNPRTAEEDAGREPALADAGISALAEDSKDGMWVGTRKGALWHFAAGKWQAQTNYPQGHAITAIAPEGNGDLWVGTAGDG